MKPRSMHAIIAEILRVCEQKTKRTHVIYKANLSHSMLQGYVELAWQSGLLDELPDRSLLITEKGREYLAHFTCAEKMLRINNNIDAVPSSPEEEEEEQQRQRPSVKAATAAASQVIDTYT
ncbi:winged helix-turn-helix domain-containing protein [Candidatus Nitrososphaera evergladensis]|nr:winged helix-turn-helix domain-containing protein [Candidatus Nitrososphaera evergladensis]